MSNAMSQPKVTAIIPNYNGSALLKETLPAVLKALRPGDELLIVDDASTDSSVAELRSQYKLAAASLSVRSEVSSEYQPKPHQLAHTTFQAMYSSGAKKITVTLVALVENQRFAAAVNMGAAYAQHQYFFVCNSDAQPAPDCIAQALGHFSDTSVFAVGCREFDAAEPEQISGKNKLWFARGMFVHSRADEFSFGETAWASGGSAVIDAKKWFLLAGFDLRFYPAYWEDIDLSFRARKRGWKVLFDPEAVVEHTHESTNTPVFGTDSIAQMSWKNAFAFTWKNGSPLQRLQFLLWLPYWMWKRYV